MSSDEIDSSYGRVVKLHFACVARLPIGSSLRITSSQLWAPGMSTPSDPTDAKNVSQQANASALPDNSIPSDFFAYDEQAASAGILGSSSFGNADASIIHSYASSVEMVTCPDTYPLWRTKKPVIVSLRHHHGRYEHHHYRYMIVNPGAKPNEQLGDGFGKEEKGDDDEQSVKGFRSSNTNVSTTNEENFSTEVMCWEDPFQIDQAGKESQKDLAARSAASLTSVKRNVMSKSLANLPYRTVHIDTLSAAVQARLRHSDSSIGENSDDEAQFTSDGIRIDTWNNANDYTFYPYTVREELNKQNKLKRKSIISRYTSFNSQDTDSTASINPKDALFKLEKDAEIKYPPKLNTKVSFSHLNISPEKERAPSEVVVGEKGSEMNSGYESNASSLTMTPKTYASSASLKSAFNRRKRQRIYFVCYHLPVIVTYIEMDSEYKIIWAESLLAATEGSRVLRDYEAHWIGTVSCSNRPIVTDEDKEAVRKLLDEMKCTPLFLDNEVSHAHYHGMCKQVLWPAFHNVDLLDLAMSGIGKDNASQAEFEKFHATEWDQSKLGHWWQAYQTVNVAFGDMLAEILEPGDIAWVHDYHLCLLPKIVDDFEKKTYGRSMTKKVFLLHIPFPTSHIFRELECGEEILKGMLHADVVGFHSFDHARHFLAASKRILGLNHENMIGGLIGIEIGRKTVIVTMHNVSVEPLQLDAALSMPSVKDYTTKLRHDHSSRLIISGVDIAQSLSGISLKLMAFENLLKDYPIYQKKVVLIQKCLVPGNRILDEVNTLSEVRKLVQRIKKKFGPHVIDYEEINGSSLQVDKRVALWKVSDILMSTPIREGLNLLPQEYVYCRKKPSHPGVIITSEFAVVSSVLNGSLRVNSFDIKNTVTTLDKALTMTAQEKDTRRERDEAFVTSCTSSQWTRSVLQDLYDATAATSDGDDNESDDTSIMGSKFDRQQLITSTAQFLAHEREIAFSRLDIKSAVSAYRRTKNRVLILDLNGTIINKEPPGKYLKRDTLGSSGFDVHPEVKDALKRLSADPSTTVFVVSGDSQENVVKAIGDVSGVGIAASNGACFAPPLKDGEGSRNWKYFDLGVNWEEVKKIVLPILSKYTARSNGSFIKLTHSSIGWSYYSCDPEWGSLQASHLVLELEHELQSFDVRFVMIKGIVEVVPKRLNKGLIVKNVLREVQDRSKKSNVDFILCMGDDIQDEKMFTSVFSFISEQDSPEAAEPGPPIVGENGKKIIGNISYRSETSFDEQSEQVASDQLFAFTCTVGKKSSHAFTYVDDARDVATVLMRLAGLDRDSSITNEEIAGI